MFGTNDKLTREIRDSLLVSAKTVVDERAKNRQQRQQMTWAVARAFIQVGGFLFGECLGYPRGWVSPAAKCLDDYGDLGREQWSTETHD